MTPIVFVCFLIILPLPLETTVLTTHLRTSKPSRLAPPRGQNLAENVTAWLKVIKFGALIRDRPMITHTN